MKASNTVSIMDEICSIRRRSIYRPLTKRDEQRLDRLWRQWSALQ